MNVRMRDLPSSGSSFSCVEGLFIFSPTESLLLLRKVTDVDGGNKYPVSRENGGKRIPTEIFYIGLSRPCYQMHASFYENGSPV